jgi:hypothetical protein
MAIPLGAILRYISLDSAIFGFGVRSVLLHGFSKIGSESRG